MVRFLSKDRIVAPAGYNRWRVPPASAAIHLCIGSVYAWSIFNLPLTRIIGVVTGAGGDWSLSEVVWIFTVAIVFLGLSAAFAGEWLYNTTMFVMAGLLAIALIANALTRPVDEKHYMDGDGQR